MIRESFLIKKNSTITVCPVCRTGRKFKFIMESGLRGGNFSLYLCKNCKVQFWYPMKNPGGRWYQENNPYKIREIIKTKLYRGYHKRFLERAKNLPCDIKILDLGCGTGEFLSELSKIGFTVFGTDFDEEAIKIAKKRFGLENVFADSFEDFFEKLRSEKFDVITFFEVLEHLDDHEKFITNIKKILKPKGMIALSVPSRERALVNWNKWDFPPHHFTRWNKESIENIFSKYGFKVNFVDYVEVFRITMGAIDGKLRSELMQKSFNKSKNNKNLFVFKALFLAAKLKQWVLAGIPAFFIWLYGKITKRRNGIIYMELVYE